MVVPDDIDDAELDPLVGWRLQRDCGVRADVFPCRSADFREDRTTPNTLAHDAAVDGLLIYERELRTKEIERRIGDNGPGMAAETVFAEGRGRLNAKP